MAPPRRHDLQLAWQAVRPELKKRARRRRMWDTLLTAGIAPGLTRTWESHRLSRYALAVDVVAQRLTDDELAALRTCGQLPAWFLRAVLGTKR